MEMTIIELISHFVLGVLEGAFIAIVVCLIIAMIFFSIRAFQKAYIVAKEEWHEHRKQKKQGVLPCPVCGAKDGYYFYLAHDYDHLKCKMCQFDTRADSCEECLKKWNKASRKAWKQ